jgi:hypothetical protein
VLASVLGESEMAVVVLHQRLLGSERLDGGELGLDVPGGPAAIGAEALPVEEELRDAGAQRALIDIRPAQAGGLHGGRVPVVALPVDPGVEGVVGEFDEGRGAGIADQVGRPDGIEVGVLEVQTS